MKNGKAREIFFGIIACLMLVIYVLALGNIILSVLNWDPQSGEFSAKENLVWVVNLLGGIVSAVVIGNLAISDPGVTPTMQVMEMSKDYGTKVMQTVVWIYIGVWLLIGLAAFYVGVIKCPDVYGTLNDMGKSWLGVVVGALVAWFGIKENK
ncbi:MAG TPA: hypothetical protein PKH02_09890 [Bacteroidales bacterium]|nr:hypothetical protein [Bacteroidales bacterium]HPT12101.1 hypothetical protein [Bacteroidales bacterium]